MVVAAAGDPLTLTAAEATARVARAMGHDLTLVGALAGGETGATEIRDGRGGRFVLKWESDRELRARRLEGVVLAERLRTEASWPVPRQEPVEDREWLFVVQELLPGRPVTLLAHRMVDTLLGANEAQRGLAKPTDPDRWAEDLITTLTEGGNGYCRHDSLRAHDGRTRRIVERVERQGLALRPEHLPGRDVVHWDLHPGNLLQLDGRLSAIVDLDFAKVGDADFDLVTLAVASLAAAAEPGVRKRLFAAVDERLDEPRRSAYVGHLLVRILDWPIRKGRPAEVEHWIAQADRLLDGG